jgi:uncharacterized membrane protein
VRIEKESHIKRERVIRSMGLFDWFKKDKKERSGLRKAFEEKRESERTVTIQKSESLPAMEHVYTPTVEHPLLSIQDKMTKLEEIYRSLNEKVDKKLATKEDVTEMRGMLSESLEKSESIMGGINDLDKKIVLFEGRKSELTRKIDTSNYELTQDLGELKQVERTLKLLEADKKVLGVLDSGELSTIELSEKVGYSRQYLWGRLKQMENNGLVKSFKTGRQTKYALTEKNVPGQA